VNERNSGLTKFCHVRTENVPLKKKISYRNSTGGATLSSMCMRGRAPCKNYPRHFCISSIGTAEMTLGTLSVNGGEQFWENVPPPAYM